MKAIYIIDKRSSTTIFHRSYSDMAIDSDLLSGMLTALNQLSEVEMRGKGIESIEMGGLSWVYINYEALGVMLIAADTRGVIIDVMRARLEIILRTFIAQFGITVENWDQIWTGEYSKFDNFAETMDQLVEQWDMAENALGAAALFDMLGVFQQIFITFASICRVNFFKDKLEHVRQSLQQLQDEIQGESRGEIDKITYDPAKLEWSILAVNPQFVNSSDLVNILLRITRRYKSEIEAGLGRLMAINEFSKKIFPFLVQNYDMFSRLSLLAQVLEIFLL